MTLHRWILSSFLFYFPSQFGSVNIDRTAPLPKLMDLTFSPDNPIRKPTTMKGHKLSVVGDGGFMGRASSNVLALQVYIRVSPNDTSVTPRYGGVAKMVYYIYDDTW